VVFDQSLFVKRAIETAAARGGIGLALTAIMVRSSSQFSRRPSPCFSRFRCRCWRRLIALYMGGSSINTIYPRRFSPLVFSRLIDQRGHRAREHLPAHGDGEPRRSRPKRAATRSRWPCLRRR